MSYILDALRRAQAERGRGSVPDLHTAPMADAAPAAAPARGLVWVLLAALAAVIAVGGWWLWRMQARAERAVAAATQPAPAPMPAPAPAPAPVIPPPAPVPVPVPVPAPPSPAPAPAPRPPAPAPKPARAEAPPRPAAPAPAPAPKPAAPAAPVFAQADLPPAVREQLPTLQLAGITYSANPQHRMAIVNGQVMHEGDQAAPGLVLERIEPGRTVWSFRGYRYAVDS